MKPSTRRCERDSLPTLLRLHAAAQAFRAPGSLRSFAMLAIVGTEAPTPSTVELPELAADDLHAALDALQGEAARRRLACVSLVGTWTRARFEVDGEASAESRCSALITCTDNGVERRTFLVHADPADARFGQMTEVEFAPDGAVDQCAFTVPLPVEVLRGSELFQVRHG